MLTSLYIHIPFCKHICTYCDFHKEIATLEKKKNYIDALLQEIELYKEEIKHVETIYIGGGTPTNLPLKDLERLFVSLTNVIDTKSIKEYTIEVNPDDINEELAILFQTHHINRVSMGVQTFNQDHLTFLNRTHSKEDVLNTITLLKNVGITNINVDMIFNIPNQTLEELETDLLELTNLDIKHVSYYSLILEEKSILYQLVKKQKVTISDQDIEGDMYLKVIDHLERHGYSQYEISNFSKDGLDSLHNLSYWTNKEYLGLGSGSHSMIDNKRLYNVSNVRRYIEGILDKTHSKEEYDYGYLNDYLMTGLRLTKGINIAYVNQLYNVDVLTKFHIKEFIKKDILEIKNGYLRFTKEGILIGNVVFLELLEG